MKWGEGVPVNVEDYATPTVALPQGICDVRLEAVCPREWACVSDLYAVLAKHFDHSRSNVRLASKLARDRLRSRRVHEQEAPIDNASEPLR